MKMRDEALRRASDADILAALRTDLRHGARLFVENRPPSGPTEQFERNRARELIAELVGR